MATNDLCYIISGTVKISVALVLYRLVERVYSNTRCILIIDIISCAIFNSVTTIILALGCVDGTPYTFKDELCKSVNYAQGASYIIWDVFHTVLPVLILWNIQMSPKLKAGVIGLLAIGLLYVLLLLVDFFNAAVWVKYGRLMKEMYLQSCNCYSVPSPQLRRIHQTKFYNDSVTLLVHRSDMWGC